MCQVTCNRVYFSTKQNGILKIRCLSSHFVELCLNGKELWLFQTQLKKKMKLRIMGWCQGNRCKNLFSSSERGMEKGADKEHRQRLISKQRGDDSISMMAFKPTQELH